MKDEEEMAFFTETQKAEERFRILAENIAAAVVIYQGDRLVYVNKGSEILFGHERSILLGLNLSDIVHPDHRARVTERALARQRRENVPRRYEFKIITADGQERWVEFTGEYLEIAGKPAAIGTMYDITEHRKAFSVLLEAEQKYSELFENCEEGIYQGNPGGAVVHVNPSFARSLGYNSPQEFLERIKDISREVFVDPNCYTRLMAALAEQGRIRGFEAQMYCKNGETLWVSISANALFAEDLSLHSYTAFSHDITSRRNMERQLLQAHKMEAIGRLAGGIAHDFNNILTVILGYCEMLRDLIGESEKSLSVVGEIGNATKRAAMLTQQLLAFSRQQVVQRKVLDVNVVVRAMETMLKRLIGENIELMTELRKENAMVRADPHQIEQIIMNLVVNARDAMPDGGNLLIATSLRIVSEAEAANARELKSGRYIQIVVNDSGIGIPPEHVPLIFEPFFTTKIKGKGTGLGLSTVYGIVEQSGGFISVDSEPGKGASFKIYLPQEGEKPTEGGKEIDPSPLCEGSGMLLVVEDDPMVRKVTASALRSAGYYVHEAGDGEEGLALLERLPNCPDLLISDVIMPKMGGRELAAAAARRYPGIRILFLSGYAVTAPKGNGDWLRDRLFVAKPFSREELLRSVRTCLNTPGISPQRDINREGSVKEMK